MLAADEDLIVAYDPNRFNNFINDLNHRLSPLDLKLSVAIDEVKGKKIWVLVGHGSSLLLDCSNYLQGQHEGRRASSGSNGLYPGRDRVFQGSGEELGMLKAIT